MLATVSVILRTESLKKNGSAPLYIRFINNRKKVDISLRMSIQSKQGVTKSMLEKKSPKDRLESFNWNKGKERVTRGYGNAESMNRLIETEKNRAVEIILGYELKGKKINSDTFKKEFLKKGNTQDFACDYFLKELEKRKDDYASETYRSYSSIITKLQDYNSKATLHDLTEEYIKEYVDYMLKPIENGGKGNDQRTVANNLKVIKTFINIAVKNGDILKDESAFIDYKIKRGKSKTRRNFIEPDELKVLEKLIQNYEPIDKPVHLVTPEIWEERKEQDMLPPSEHNVLRYFLFACYTGLRYKDIQLLDYSHIRSRKVKIDDSNSKFVDRYFIDLDMHKTGFNVTIPLLANAMNLLDLTKKKGKVFHVISNQKTNKYLKGVIKKAKIDKTITFHCARHTFASVSLMYDLPEKFVQNILGHQNSKTTEIYTHVVDDYLFRHANTLNDKMSVKKEVPLKADNEKLSMLDKLASLDMAKLEKAMQIVNLMS